MKIEEEIKQTKFNDEFHKLTLNIMFTGSWLETKGTQLLRDFDLTTQQFNVLRILRGQYPNHASVGLVTERMLDKSSNVTRLIDKLKEKGLVSRCEHEGDRRKQELLITNKGLKLLKSIDPQINRYFKAMFKHMNEQEAKQANKILDKMRG